MFNILKRAISFNKINSICSIKNFKRNFSDLVVDSYLSEIVSTSEFQNEPIYSEQIIDYFNPQNGDVILDLTFGDGGHTREFLKKDLDFIILTLDRDPNSYLKSIELAKYDQRIYPMLGKFSDINKLFFKNKIDYESINCVMLELGVSTSQLNDVKRGFRLSLNSNLDMRMDGNRCKNSITAKHVLNILDANSLEKIFKIYGSEKNAKKYANTIIDSRHLLKNINCTYDLSYLINRLHSDEDDIDLKTLHLENYASKIFLALRLFVNNELNELNYCLEHIRKYLKKDKKLIEDFKNYDLQHVKKKWQTYDSGKIACIFYNKLEKIIVNKHFNELDEDSMFFINKGRNNSNFDFERDLKRISNNKYLKTPVEDDKEKSGNVKNKQTAELKTALRIN